ncbi:ESX secretion-associated protein EspG [Crossiella sp. SN42]|uniref:ESX secretion-associated protein EspG n=1 Tax=Crossiella sp. SN42 TaxID=2944808 RepID=UPI00207C8A55|nr:ESX secretion-associated protein EspG [Crossiella sp. SN42]MCO1575861.1 ESX secretion-associated protein EspG [Crossiella sp. SN42]
MTTHPTSVTALTVAEFDLVWELAELGETPVNLEIASGGVSWEERLQRRHEVLAALTERGLAVRGGLRPDLRDAVTVLARFQWAVDLRLWGGELVRAVGAVDGPWAAVAVRYGDEVQLGVMPDYAVLGTMVDLVGAMPAGPGESVSVRADALDASRDAASAPEFADALTERGEPAPTARKLAHMLGAVLGGGQFGATVRDGRLGLRRAARVVSFHDTPQGRYLHVRRNGWATITPGGQEQLLAQVRALVEEQRG